MRTLHQRSQQPRRSMSSQRLRYSSLFQVQVVHQRKASSKGRHEFRSPVVCIKRRRWEFLSLDKIVSKSELGADGSIKVALLATNGHVWRTGHRNNVAYILTQNATRLSVLSPNTTQFAPSHSMSDCPLLCVICQSTRAFSFTRVDTFSCVKVDVLDHVALI